MSDYNTNIVKIKKGIFIVGWNKNNIQDAQYMHKNKKSLPPFFERGRLGNSLFASACNGEFERF